MSSTPRAEQFEDRLKTIIHSVLAGDSDHRDVVKGNQDVKPPLHVMPYNSTSPTQGASSTKPMFSPVKKELPVHLPLPPSGIVGTEGGTVPQCRQPYNTTSAQPYPTTSAQPLGPHSQQRASPAGTQAIPPAYHIPPASVFPNTQSHPSASPTVSRQSSRLAETGPLQPGPRPILYHQSAGATGRPLSVGEIGGLTSRTVSDVISNEIERSIGPAMTSRPLDDPRNRGREYPGYTAQMHEGSPNHGLPKAAHSNAVTSRMPVSSGAPSMARMSQGIIKKCLI